ncbi:MAG: hypothetical protein JXA25_12865 [Anaerolineales bacterium]|nr:hypothetical protein [Anaerolineales bacterium]
MSKVLVRADGNIKEIAAFLGMMFKIAAHPGREKNDNRLHHKKSCDLCTMPCRYGYFTLMVEPDYESLLALLDAENKKLVEERDPVRVLWTYTMQQIWNLLEIRGGYDHPDQPGESVLLSAASWHRQIAFCPS